MTGGTTELHGWVLVRVVRARAHPAWFLAIATGLSPGRTVLGTSLAPLAAPDAVAQLRTQEARVSPSAGRLSVEVDVRNAGAAPWPVSVPDGAASDYTVRLVARWYPGSDHDGPLPPPQEIALPHDVDPGESIAVNVDVATPSVPGNYELDLRVQQVHGSAFDGPENHPLRLQIAILDSLLERAVPSRTSQQVGPGSRNQTRAAAPFSYMDLVRVRVPRRSASIFREHFKERFVRNPEEAVRLLAVTVPTSWGLVSRGSIFST